MRVISYGGMGMPNAVGSTPQAMSDALFTVAGDFTGQYAPEYMNAWWDRATNTDKGTGGDISVRCGLLSADKTINYGYWTFGGSPTGTIPNGGFARPDGFVGTQPPKGAKVIVRTWMNAPAGFPYVAAQGLNFTSINAPAGERFRYGASVTDGTQGTGDYTSTNALTMYAPVGLYALATSPAIFAFGDSECAGFGGGADVNNTRGLISPTLAAAGLPHVNIGAYGELAQGYITGSTIRRALYERGNFTALGTNLGINDVSGGRSGANIISDLTTIRGFFPGKPFFFATPAPVIGSYTDLTLASGQTAANFDAQRVIVAEWMRTLPNGLAFCMDTALALESAKNSGVYASSTPALVNTDKIHPTTTGYERARNAPGFDASKLASPTPIAAATRLLASAARAISPIDGVMGTLPTISQGADFAASLVNPAMTISYGSGMYQANDLAVFESVSGKIVLGPSGNQYQGQGMTGNRSTLAKRGQSGQGLRFMTSAIDMDFCMNLSAANFVIYVTDVATGVRARASDGDITFGSSNWRYVRLTFATRASRIIEVYTTNLGAFRGINCEAGYTITKAPASPEAKITILGDSWANGQLSGGTKSVKLNWATYFAERFGVVNPNQSANGGTGLLNPGGTNGTYRERVLAGDIDVSFIGEQDLVAIQTSVNDTNFTAVDADCQTEMQLLTAEVMARQPNAVIVAWGPQTTLGTTTPQSRHDAIRAGFLAAAGGNKRCIWLDSSPAGLGWFADATERAAWIGSDNTHPNDPGKIGYGRRAGNASVAAVQALAA